MQNFINAFPLPDIWDNIEKIQGEPGKLVSTAVASFAAVQALRVEDEQNMKTAAAAVLKSYEKSLEPWLSAKLSA